MGGMAACPYCDAICRKFTYRGEICGKDYYEATMSISNDIQ
jgi:hypothetical protein